MQRCQSPFPASLRIAGLLLGLLLLLGTGCTSQPLRPDSSVEPELATIQRAFDATLARAYADPERRWHSGWAGNVWVNMAGERDLGLCYHWQRLVYRGVLPTVRDVRWHANGIVINKGTRHEHHAVIVFDPRQADQDRILTDPENNPAWVLDAWRRGRADIYPVVQWVESSWFRQVPPRITGVVTDEN